MSAIPGSLHTDEGPPMTVPLRHFLVGLCFLLAGLGVGLALAAGVVPGRARLAHVHLLLAGWIGVTIMGAMTQFVPVWSGTALYSRRLASLQLALVALGLAGFATAMVLGATAALVGFGSLLAVGFLTFVYNVGRTLAGLDEYDVTERHFLGALAAFLALAPLGVLLALDVASGVLAGLALDHAGLRGAHATIAVFGAVVTTVYGALYQLATMFTGTTLGPLDHRLRLVEEVTHPVGVALLAAGRLLHAPFPARLGGVLLVVAALAVAVVLARRLWTIGVDWTPMHTRYAVAVPALVAWALLALPAWLAAPTADASLLGAAGTGHLLLLGFVGFVVLGTLYHVVPFVVWVHRYSDRVGLEPVPMVDDLYDGRLAALDGALLSGGTAVLVLSSLQGLSAAVVGVGGALVFGGAAVFCANVVLVLRRHSPHGLDYLLLGAAATLPAVVARRVGLVGEKQ